MKITLLILILCSYNLLAQGELKLRETIYGEKEGDDFSSICMAGDVNGDGFNDFLIGSIQSNYVKLYYGDTQIDTSNYLRFFNNESGNGFTNCYTGNGDLNGDGYKDFALCAYNGPQTGNNVFVYLGGNINDTIPKPIYGGQPVAMNGDLNGDGLDDLIIVQNAIYLGMIYIFWGGKTINIEPDVTIFGKELGDFFGSTASICGDLNKDGFDDLLVSAPNSFIDENNIGKVFLFWGGQNIGWENSVEINSNRDATGYGIQISALGDVDGDEYPDFAILSWYADIISGKNLTHIKNIIPKKEWGTFWGISNGYDLNGDGLNDFILGFENNENHFSGGIAIYYGGKQIDTIPALVLSGEYSHSEFGRPIIIDKIANNNSKPRIFVGEGNHVCVYDWDHPNSIHEKDELSPYVFFLYQNYPNPFNPVTTISYTLPSSGNVQVKIFDVLGREVTKLVDEQKSAGKYTVEWNGSSYASGIYFYSITFNSQTLYKKMLLIK